MKKLAMVLAVAFTMGLAASTVSAGTKDNKTKTESTSTEKKESCSSDKKACCSSEKKAEAPAEKPAK